MKKVKHYLLLVLFVTVSCLFFVKDGISVEAAGTDFSKKYFGDTTIEGYIFEEVKFDSKCRLKIRVDFQNRHFNSLEVEIYDKKDLDDYDGEDAEPVFQEEISMADSPYIKTITLPAGTYYVDVEGEKNDWYSGDAPASYSVVLTGEYIPELSNKSITLEEGKTKTLKVRGTKKSVRWNSSNKKIATVNNKGLVKAKKAGKATITAISGQYNLKCTVTVKKKPVTYSQMAKKMKTFAGKNRNFTYKTVDVGNECRLYAKWLGGVDNSKIHSEGYAMGSMVRPYLQLVKKSGKPELRLRVQGRMDVNSLSSTGLYCSKIQFGTSGRRISFAMKQTSGRNTYDPSAYIYKGRMEGYITISTSSKTNASSLKKWNNMLGQKSLYVRVISSNGAYYQGGVPAKTRSEWKKLVKEYNTLLKEF